MSRPGGHIEQAGVFCRQQGGDDGGEREGSVDHRVVGLRGRQGDGGHRRRGQCARGQR